MFFSIQMGKGNYFLSRLHERNPFALKLTYGRGKKFSRSKLCLSFAIVNFMGVLLGLPLYRWLILLAYSTLQLSEEAASFSALKN